MSLAANTQTQSLPGAGAGNTASGAGAVTAARGLAPGGRLLTVSEVADLLRINKSTVYRMAKQGRLPATRVGRQWRFRKSVLDRILEPA